LRPVPPKRSSDSLFAAITAICMQFVFQETQRAKPNSSNWLKFIISFSVGESTLLDQVSFGTADGGPASWRRASDSRK
jgi:hypothetical protein